MLLSPYQALAKRNYFKKFGIKQLSSTVLAYDVHKSSHGQECTDSIVFLHGILGSKKNWRTVGNTFVRRHEHFKAVVMDHRGHGKSPIIAPTGPHTVAECVKDVTNTLGKVDNEGIDPSILCGHSFSGKVVLKCLEHRMKEDLPLPAHTWVLDSLPGPYFDTSDNENSVRYLLHTLGEMKVREFPNKDWILNYLIEKGFRKPVALWILTNLVPVDPKCRAIGLGPCKFSFSIETILELFDDFCTLDMWQFLEEYDGASTIHYLRAGRNTAWNDAILKRFHHLCEKNPYIKLHTMPHVGHWLHTEDVNGMIDTISTHSNL